MAENLNYLPGVAGPETGSDTDAYYYVYGYDGTSVTEAKATANYSTYGVLYNWPAAMAGEPGSSSNPNGVQGVCPTGWHLPGDDEWTELADFLGGRSFAGGKLKESGTTHWDSPNSGATNESGLTALPGGYRREPDGTFESNGFSGNWWTTTSEYTSYASFRFLVSSDGSLHGEDISAGFGFAVLCLRD